MTNFTLSKGLKALTHPSLVIRHIHKLYKIYITQDEFALAHRDWVRDKGDETKRLNYQLNKGSVVFDLGGYKGDFAEDVYSRYNCSVFLFEPAKEFYDISEKRFANNPKVQCFNFGLSDINKEVFISDEDDGSSLVKGNTANNLEKVQVKRFDETQRAINVGKIDLLKINIEGGEYDVLPHLIKENIIQNIDNIQVQFHNFIDNAEQMREKIRADLAKTHDEVWCYPFVWESWTLKK